MTKNMNDLQVQFMTFCDYATISQENKLSIIGIFNELRVQQLPGGLASAFLVAIVRGKPDSSYHLTVKGDLDDKNIFPAIEMDMRTGMSGINNVVINLSNMGFPKTGEYRFSISNNGQEIGFATIRVIHVTQNESVKYKLPN